MSSSATRQSPAVRAAVAAALAQARRSAGLSRAELADRAQIDVSVLSRLEGARYFHRLKASTLEALTRALSCGQDLYHAAAMPHPDVISLAADEHYHRAFASLPATRLAIRRLHLQELAAPFASQALTADGRRVDEKKLWRRVTGTAITTGHHARWGDGTAATRFGVAHSAAHTLLETICRWPRVEASEQEANEMAAMLLAPAAQISQALKTVLSGPRDLWASDAEGILEAVADFLVIPGWVALRCLGAARELDFYLQQEEQE